jgi:transcriptional regulator with XRE-family HTH domain
MLGTMKSDQVSIAMRKNLGTRIRYLREERGMSQGAFASKISVSRTYLSGLENGKKNVSIDSLGKIARGFDIPLSEMFKDVDSFIYEYINFPEA